jgi:transcriptional regulator with XRE-family HTH domain
MLSWLGFVTVQGVAALPAVTTDGLPIGMMLKIERTLARITTTHVARAVGISVGHLSRIESGERTASPEMVERIRVAIRAAERAA